jgi:polysaccharide deacetylase family protein (PEP-CTERM system associated)
MTTTTYALKPLTPRRHSDRIVNVMSVDVEEYFQVQALSSHIKPEDWVGRDSRVEYSTNVVLDLFAAAGVKATFFTLGWVAERHPNLITRIVKDGHELASHGYSHVRVDSQTPDQFRADIRRTKGILEAAGGVKVNGYRAATFSIDLKRFWAFPILQEEGYTYSSSISPIAHDLYGIPDAPRRPFYPVGEQGLVEHPIATLRLANRNWPCGGGGFFRLLPYMLSQFAIARINQTDQLPAVFYFHPWEVDPDQPRVPGLSLKSRLRHYTNLTVMAKKLRKLTQDFAWDRMDRVYDIGSSQSDSVN